MLHSECAGRVEGREPAEEGSGRRAGGRSCDEASVLLQLRAHSAYQLCMFACMFARTFACMRACVRSFVGACLRGCWGGQVEGLKVVAFGPFDLSVAMGFDGVRTPEVYAHPIDSVRGGGVEREGAEELGKGGRVQRCVRRGACGCVCRVAELRAVACRAKDSKEGESARPGLLALFLPP